MRPAIAKRLSRTESPLPSAHHSPDAITYVTKNAQPSVADVMPLPDLDTQISAIMAQMQQAGLRHSANALHRLTQQRLDAAHSAPAILQAVRPVPMCLARFPSRPGVEAVCHDLRAALVKGSMARLEALPDAAEALTALPDLLKLWGDSAGTEASLAAVRLVEPMLLTCPIDVSAARKLAVFLRDALQPLPQSVRQPVEMHACQSLLTKACTASPQNQGRQLNHLGAILHHWDPLAPQRLRQLCLAVAQLHDDAIATTLTHESLQQTLENLLAEVSRCTVPEPLRAATWESLRTLCDNAEHSMPPTAPFQALALQEKLDSLTGELKVLPVRINLDEPDVDGDAALAKLLQDQEYENAL